MFACEYDAIIFYLPTVNQQTLCVNGSICFSVKIQGVSYDHELIIADDLIYPTCIILALDFIAGNPV